MFLNDARQLPARNPRTRRTVIVGAGAVGLYAARELARLGQEVVVVESGGVHLGNFAPDGYATVGRKHDGIRIGRSRSLGGTSNLWGGQLVEFQPVDFAGRDWLPGSRWPVSYEEIRPYYRRTYENLGIPVAAQEDGPVFEHFLGSKPTFEEGLEIFLTRWMKIPSFAVLYAKALRDGENPRLLLNHTVVGFAATGDRITAIRAIAPSGQVHAIEGDRFVLAAGTIEVSRLLLHAARDSGWACPWRDNANVGARFQDHLGGPIAEVHPRERKRFYEVFCTMVWSGNKFQPKVRLTNDALEQARNLNVHGMFLFESSVGENLVYLKQFLKAALQSRKVSNLGDLFVNLRACAKYLVPLMWKYVVDNRIFVPSGAKISLVAQAEQTPLPESRIRIDPSHVDGSGLPRTLLEWKLGDHELRSLREFAGRCDRAMRAAGLAELSIPDALLRLEPSFLETLRDTNHQAGGACMGTSAEDGVVDRNLRVFGTDNLYVAGAATFPSSSGANTTFTALSFTTRLVERLGTHDAVD